MKMRLFTILAILSFFLAGYPCAGEAAPQKLKISTNVPDADPQTRALKEVFKKYVEEKTNGKYQVDVYSNGSLGNPDTIFQGIQFGTINLAIDSLSNVSPFAQKLALSDLPYLFPSVEAISYIFEQPEGQKLLEELKKKKVVPLSVFPSNFRIVVSTSPVTKLEDIQNVKWRTTASKSHMNAIDALGAAPTPMPATEMLTGLQQGVIKALDQDPNSWVGYGTIDVAPYAATADHIPVIYVMYASEKWLNKLPEEDRQIIMEGLEKFKQASREGYDQERKDVLENRAPARGGKITYLSAEEKARWKEKSSSAYKNLSQEDKKIVEDIQALGEKFEQEKNGKN